MWEAIADNLVTLSVLGALATGYVADRVVGFKREKRREAREALVARCGCSHVFSAHALEEPHACTDQVKRQHYDNRGNRNGWEYVTCPCKRYDGPIPIETVFQAPKPLRLPRGDT